jgi:hypothetical protein
MRILEFFRRASGKEEVEYPVFNLEVTRNKFREYLKEHDSTGDFIGEFLVYNSGKLKRGFGPSFHISEASLEYADDHIHFPNGAVVDIEKNRGGLFLKATFELPRLTLAGFYEINKRRRGELEEEALEEYIRKFNPEFEFNSISRNKETRVKLLENAYKRYISDQ